MKAGSPRHSQPRGTQPRHSICPGLFPVRVPCAPWIQAHNPGWSPPLGPESHLRVPRPQVQGDDGAVSRAGGRGGCEVGRGREVGEGADSGTRVAPHLGAPVPDGAAELGGGGGQGKDLCVSQARGGPAGPGVSRTPRLPVPSPCWLPTMAMGWSPSKPPSPSQFIPRRVPSP